MVGLFAGSAAWAKAAGTKHAPKTMAAAHLIEFQLFDNRCCIVLKNCKFNVQAFGQPPAPASGARLNPPETVLTPAEPLLYPRRYLRWTVGGLPGFHKTIVRKARWKFLSSTKRCLPLCLPCAPAGCRAAGN